MYTCIAIVCVVAWYTLAIWRGEEINAVWFVVVALSSFALALRFYSKFIERKVLTPNDQNLTPAYEFNNGHDYHPTDKRVLFGHHFAAIAGAGPLVGPILAAQMGYLPSTLWIIFGVILAGGVQDFFAMFISMRRGGQTIWQTVFDKLGRVAGGIFAVFLFIMLAICFSFLALVCTNAIAESPWAVFSIGLTIPIALFMGIYQKFIRPGKVFEVSIIGVVLLLAAIIGGGLISETPLGGILTLSPLVIAILLIIYGTVAASLPVWLLLAPRDYLSTFMKIGTIGLLTIGIIIAHPNINMPDFTAFAFNTDGPVFSGNLFPFLFITIACGALSGAHSLFCSGTTPKMIEKESQVRFISYGAMLTEAFVAVIALVAAISLSQGVYFSMNMSPASIKTLAGENYSITASPEENAAAAIDNLGITDISGRPAAIRWTDEQGNELTGASALHELAEDVGEKSIVSRTGGAPTLAVGIADILHQFLGGKFMLGFWYHFAIMFEALFILSSIDAGTRVMKLQVSEMLASFGGRRLRKFKNKNWVMGGVIATLVATITWGSLLIMGILDPTGGVRAMLPLFGISNQLLAGCALLVATYITLLKGKGKFALIPGLPALFALSVTLTASFQKIFSSDVNIGYFALRGSVQSSIDSGNLSGEVLETAVTTANNALIQGSLMVIFTVLVIAFLAIIVRRFVKFAQHNHPKPGADETVPQIAN